MRSITLYISISLYALGLHAQTAPVYNTAFLDTAAHVVNASVIKKSTYAVLFFLSDECTICRYYTIGINNAAAQYSSDSIKFYGIFPQTFSTPAAIKEWQQTYHIHIPLYADTARAFTKSLDARITPQVIVLNTLNGNVIYSGRIDDAYVRIGRQKGVVTHHELDEVLQSISKHEQVTTVEVPPIGCYISFK